MSSTPDRDVFRITIANSNRILLPESAYSVADFNFGEIPAIAQDTATPPHLNLALPPEVLARDLVGRMTLEEKASLLVNQARVIPRLKVPAYDWWSEALHGVAVNGTTEFPEPIGLGAAAVASCARAKKGRLAASAGVFTASRLFASSGSGGPAGRGDMQHGLIVYKLPNTSGCFIPRRAAP